MPTETEESRTRLSDTPDIKWLAQIYTQATPVYSGWHRLADNDAERYARWTPQFADQKKHDSEGQAATPWEGASDQRVMLTDDIINELVAVLLAAHARAVENCIQGTNAGTDAQAASARDFLRWVLKSRLQRELPVMVELSAQYFLTYGKCILHPYWRQEVELEPQAFTMEELRLLAAQSPEIASLLELVQNPELETEAAKQVQAFAGQLIQAQLAKESVTLEAELADYEPTLKQARKLVRDLRDTGVAELPVPYFCVNGPAIDALKVYEDVNYPAGLHDLQTGPIMHVRKFSLVQFESEAMLRGWDEKWVQQCKTKRGVQCDWGKQDTAIAALDNTVWQLNWNDEEEDEVWVWFAYYWQLGAEDDIKRIVETVFRPDLTEAWGKHGPVELPPRKLPYVLGRLEVISKMIDICRGLPERLQSRQRLVKVLMDSTIDEISIKLVPPVNVPKNSMSAHYRFGPLARNEVRKGDEPKFMEMPEMRNFSVQELAAMVRRDVNNACGTLDPDVPPMRSQTVLQKMVDAFLRMWSEGYEQLFCWLAANGSDEEWQLVTGAATPKPNVRDVRKGLTFILAMDSRELDLEHVVKRYEAITKGVLPYDTDNVIRKGALVAMMTQAISPSLAQRILAPPAEGVQELYHQTQEDLMRMFTGNEPSYLRDNDPAAAKKLEFAEQIVAQNKKYQAALTPGEGLDIDFAQRMEKYKESLVFNIQQQQNKVTFGRTGVDAVGQLKG
jgi:hypothetical protein